MIDLIIRSPTTNEYFSFPSVEDLKMEWGWMSCGTNA